MKTFLLTLSILCALMAAGLIFGWGFGVFDDRTWRQHSTAWLALSAAAFAGSWHPWIVRADDALNGRWR